MSSLMGVAQRCASGRILKVLRSTVRSCSYLKNRRYRVTFRQRENRRCTNEITAIIRQTLRPGRFVYASWRLWYAVAALIRRGGSDNIELVVLSSKRVNKKETNFYSVPIVKSGARTDEISARSSRDLSRSSVSTAWMMAHIACVANRYFLTLQCNVLCNKWFNRVASRRRAGWLTCYDRLFCESAVHGQCCRLKRRLLGNPKSSHSLHTSVNWANWWTVQYLPSLALCFACPIIAVPEARCANSVCSIMSLGREEGRGAIEYFG